MKRLILLLALSLSVMAVSANVETIEYTPSLNSGTSPSEPIMEVEDSVYEPVNKAEQREEEFTELYEREDEPLRDDAELENDDDL